jgi:tRNA 2-selenouridine synthase
VVKRDRSAEDSAQLTKPTKPTNPTKPPKANEVTHERVGRSPTAVTVAQLSDFDEVIDVRSEGEYAEDHVPGALSCPVLDNAERALVGTIYKQQSSFEAKKIGAALVSANIARHLRERFQDRPKQWRPLVYCWRGGTRSGSLAAVLAQIGWNAGQLDGGYKAYRRAVIAELVTLPSRFRWHVVCGMTGTGKSLVLRALARAGAQVLDLEALAAHRGSVLGNLPDEPQPTQKTFESLVWGSLKRFDATRPVFVEAESKKIGRLRVPEKLIEAMWASADCLVLEAPLAVRVELLKSEYAHYVAAPEELIAQLECLTSLHGREPVQRWQALARDGRADEFVADMLQRHYDPAYTRSTLTHYPALGTAPRYTLEDASDAAVERVAAEVLRSQGV